MISGNILIPYRIDLQSPIFHIELLSSQPTVGCGEHTSKGNPMTLESIKTLKASNGTETRNLEVLKDSRGFWLRDIENDPNSDSLEQIADDSDSAIMDAIRDNGFEIV